MKRANGENRERVVSFRVTTTEYRRIRELAARYSLRQSALIRRLLAEAGQPQEVGDGK